VDLNDPGSFLNLKGLSFEDCLFLFCMSVAKKQEEKILGIMKKWDSLKKNAQGASGGKGVDGKSKPTAPQAGDAGTPSGGLGGGLLGPMFSGKGGLSVGGITDVFKGLGGGALDLAASTAPMWVPMLTGCCAAIPGVGPVIAAAGPLAGAVAPMVLQSMSSMLKSGALDGMMEGVLGGAMGLASGGAGTAPGTTGRTDGPGLGKNIKKGAVAYGSETQREAGEEAESLILGPDGKPSETGMMQLLQKEQQALTKMYELCSNMMKAMHDSQMTSIRNMR
jgi:hypothetical protein